MSLRLPILSSQDLTPEELAPFKAALLTYLRRRSPEMRQQVDSNMTITRGERVPVYTVTLQALLETRGGKLQNATKPVTAVPEKIRPPENAPAAAPPKDPIDPWQFPSEARPDFAAHADTYFVPETLQFRDCDECYQKGESGCRQCFGKGEEACPSCLGGGTQKCFYCKGLERINCIRCGGEGRLTPAGVHGTGRIARCDACLGTGKFPCTHCKEGKVKCAGCGGVGKGPCRKCFGKGSIPCAVCLGQKKLLTGLAFEASFSPFQTVVSGLAAPGPREALALALTTLKPPSEVPVPTEDTLEKQVLAADVPAGFRPTLQLLVEKLKAHLSVSTRAVKYRLEVAEGGVVRLGGYCAGQEFSFWMAPGKPDIVAEKDPLLSLGNSVAVAAEEALGSGDWKKAVGLARETLSYTRGHPEARAILSTWRRKVVRETYGLALVSAGIVAAVASFFVWNAEKGLHKIGAMAQISGLQFGVAFAAATVVLPFVLRLYRAKVRWPGLAGVFVGAHLLYGFVANGILNWNPVRNADQAALRRELATHFKFGLPKIYYEPDLAALQSLYARYKDSEADLTELESGIARQQELKAAREKDQRLFESKIAAVLASRDLPRRKRDRIVALREYYKLLSLDLGPADRALQEVEAQRLKNTSRSNSKKNRISIDPHAVRRGPRPMNWRAKPSKTPSKSGVKKSVKKPSGKKEAPTKPKRGTRLGEGDDF